jgi:signal transduction histidine kinase/ligand-binding sensor domain-containing protein
LKIIFIPRANAYAAGDKLKRRIHITLFFLALAFTRPLRAADSPFIVDVFGNGLPQSSVIAMAQTHDGYLWLGTLNGLVRFDGNSFTPFDVNNTPNLPGNKIVFLFEDSKNILWVGTDNAGLCAIENGVVKNFATGGAEKITSAFEDGNGAVWFGMASGNCFCWNDGKLDLHPANVPTGISLQLFFRSVHLQVSGKNGVTWQLQNGHVEKFRGDKLEADFGASPWPASLKRISFRTPDGILADITFDANVTAACESPDGNLVVGTLGAGVFWFETNGVVRHIAAENGLSKNFVLSLCFDSGNNLWVGTDGGGLDRVNRKIFATPSALADGVAQSISEDAQGGLWAAFNLRGLTYWLTNSAQRFDIGRESKSWSVLADDQQRVWAGTSGEGLFCFQSYNFQPVPEAAKIGPQIFSLFQSRDGKIWVGGQNGLDSFDGKNWNFFSTSDGLPPNPVRAIADDTNGNLWIGTDGGGLFSLRDGKISTANAPAKDISCLWLDADNALWVGTSSHGLACLQNGKWKSFSGSDTIVSDIGYLIQDDQKNLWVGSYEGLMRLSLTKNADGTPKILASRQFGKSDGLPAQECSAGAQPAAIRTRDGKLWFPTIAGLVSVNPADLKPNTNPPPVIIESVAIDNVEQKTNSLSSVWNGAVTLLPENEQLEIHFTGLNFSAPDHVRFRYRLEGHDKKWTSLGGLREVQIRAADLPPGNFLFRVTACNEDGVWNETGATLAITVEPPFWKTKSFLIGATLVFFGVLAGIIYLISTAKLKRELRALHQKELIEHERARIARDLHDQLGANLTQVTLLGEMAEMDKNLPHEIEQHAQQICETARETTRSLDEIVWAVNPSNDTLEGLANYACKYAQDYFALANISFRAELPSDLPATPILPEVRHNIFLAFKEAVNNVVKHARATEARVKLQLETGKFILSVEDNGRGLGDISEKKLRNGLKNMRKRLADVRGEFAIFPGPNGGTIARLIVPLAKK